MPENIIISRAGSDETKKMNNEKEASKESKKTMEVELYKIVVPIDSNWVKETFKINKIALDNPELNDYPENINVFTDSNEETFKKIFSNPNNLYGRILNKQNPLVVVELLIPYIYWYSIFRESPYDTYSVVLMNDEIKQVPMTKDTPVLVSNRNQEVFEIYRKSDEPEIDPDKIENGDSEYMSSLIRNNAIYTLITTDVLFKDVCKIKYMDDKSIFALMKNGKWLYSPTPYTFVPIM